MLRGRPRPSTLPAPRGRPKGDAVPDRLAPSRAPFVSGLSSGARTVVPRAPARGHGTRPARPTRTRWPTCQQGVRPAGQSEEKGAQLSFAWVTGHVRRRDGCRLPSGRRLSTGGHRPISRVTWILWVVRPPPGLLHGIGGAMALTLGAVLWRAPSGLPGFHIGRQQRARQRGAGVTAPWRSHSMPTDTRGNLQLSRSWMCLDGGLRSSTSVGTKGPRVQAVEAPAGKPLAAVLASPWG